MIIFIDENMPSMLAEGFDILQRPENYRLRLPNIIKVKSIKSEFGKGVADEDWIPLAGKQNSCVITQDYNINRIKHQRALCEMYNLGMFYFRPPSKTGFAYWDMVKLLTKHWPEIINVASRKNRPFSYRITSRSTKLEKM